MKYAVLLPLLILWWSLPSYARDTHIDFAPETSTDCRISDRSDTGIVLTNTLAGLDVVKTSTDQGLFLRLDIPGYSKGSWDNGSPQLPVRNLMIEIPQKASLKIHVDDVDETQVNLNDLFPDTTLFPSQGPRLRDALSEGPKPFHYNDALYSRNQFIAPQRATVAIEGTLRSVRLARVTLCPFSYNPVTHVLRVVRRMTVSLSFEDSDLALTRSLKRMYQDPVFNGPLSRIDSRLPLSKTSKDIIIDGSPNMPPCYVVVADESYLANKALREFISWKKRSGFHMIEANTSIIFPTNGNEEVNRVYLKNYLQDLYNSDHPQSYVLFVGDTTQIPSYRIGNIIINGATMSDHYTDLYYCEYTDDHLPDAYYGRFPVNTDIQLTRVAAKTLMYETCTMPSLDHLETSVIIAGADDEFSPLYANGQIVYLLNEYINADNGFSKIYAFLFDSPEVSIGGDPIVSWDHAWITTTGEDLSTRLIMQALRNGAGFVNYSGHCTEYGWFNKPAKDYEFNSNHVDDLDDTGQFGFYVSNCCESSRIEMSRPGSFGAELLLAEHKGAAAYLGAGNETFWDEDFSWSVGFKALIDPGEIANLTYTQTGYGNFDALWHTHGEPSQQWFTTAGQMVYAGNLSVETHNTDTNFDFGKYYWEIYNVMGDPSLSPYMGAPGTLTEPDLPVIIPCEVSSADIQTEPYARVALSTANELLGSALADENGYATLSFTPVENQCSLNLVITKQNFRPLEMTFVTDTFPEIPPQASFHTEANGPEMEIVVFANKQVAFTSTSTGCPTTFTWNFQGAEPPTSTDKNPTVIFRESGTFDVSLTVANANTTSDPIVKTIRVLPAEKANDKASKSKGGGCFIGALH